MLSRYFIDLANYSAHIGLVKSWIRFCIRPICCSLLPIVAWEHFFESGAAPDLLLYLVSGQRVLLGQSDRCLARHRLLIHGCSIVAHEHWAYRDDGAIEAASVTQKKEKCVGLALIFILDVREWKTVLQHWQVVLWFLVRERELITRSWRDCRWFFLEQSLLG